MKSSIVLLTLVFFVLPFFTGTEAYAKKKKKTEIASAKAEKPQSKYEKLLKKPGAETVPGKFITLHRVDNKLYFEYPLKYMGRELLIASTISKTSNPGFCTVGYKPSDPMHVKFDLVDSTLFMRTVNAAVEYNDEEPNMEEAVRMNYMEPFKKKYTVAAYNADSTAVVFDVTTLFTGTDAELSPLPNRSMGMISVSAAPKADLFFLDEMKSFEDNVSVATNMTHTVSVSLFIFKIDLGDVSNKVTRTVLLLPEDKDRMKPRVSDSRLGIFLTDKQYISTSEKDGIQSYTYANRWRLEPKDMQAWSRGELVEPVKPIVYYVDNTFPEGWKESIRKGVLRWNQAFEKIGFKNAVQVRDFPKNDPSFDPDNLKYSCIRYSPVRTMNAMGPSWVDPKTGEIVNASVLIYNDVVKLNNLWRFTQTAQVDPRVRAKKMPEEVMNESIEYVVAHEIGHTLGLMHNMSASSAFPVDSLRSESFTRKYGTTASIMDYARFNYVAQPGDKGVKVSPPVLGCYDEYAIKWLYSPVVGNLSVMDEAKVLESWVDEKAGDPLYRYGRQQIYSRYDPSAIEEDLGDDPLMASDYGVKNLKYIMSHLNEWIADDPSTEHRQFLYDGIVSQYYRYLMNVLYNVGGIYLTDVKEGTPGGSYKAVDVKKQRASLKWVIDQLRSSEWLNDEKVISGYGLVTTQISSKAYAKLVGELFAANFKVITASHFAGADYTQEDYFNDLYSMVFANTIKGDKLTKMDKIMQRSVLKELSSQMNMATPKKKSIQALGFPSLEEALAYNLDETGLLSYFKEQLREVENEYGAGYVMSQMKLQELNQAYGSGYGFLREVDASLYDEVVAYNVTMHGKILNLLKSRMANAHKEDRAHYQGMIFTLQELKK